jgi:hypothetical protein
MTMRRSSNLRSTARALAALARLRRKAAAPRSSPKLVSYRPCLETFEDRTVLSTLTVLNALDGGPGSLRDAIAAASKNDTIVFDPSLNGQTITLTSGELAIRQSLDIEGPGANHLAISGNGASRVFDISRGSLVTIAGLTITHGRADGSAPIMPSSGGGILNNGTLTLANDLLSANQTSGDPSASPYGRLGLADGGAIDNLGTLTVSGTTFTSNLAQGASSIRSNSSTPDTGSGVGGALFSSGPVNVTDSAFDHNQAIGGSQNNSTRGGTGEAGGGAIFNFGSALTVTLSRFSYNQAIGGNDNQGLDHVGLGYGGGIASGSDGTSLSTTLTVSSSTLDQNQGIGGNNNHGTSPASLHGPGVGAGGGIDVFQGTVTISDSTLDHNDAIGGQGVTAATGGLGVGAGIVLFGGFGGASVNMTDCTVSHNSAAGGPAGAGGTVGGAQGGGLFNDAGASLTLKNSTVSGNSARDGGGIYRSGAVNASNTILAGNTAPTAPDLSGKLGSLGHNLIGDTSGGSGFDTTDLINIDPLLSPLQDNGGPTQTMALLVGSPALNAGDPTQLGVADQRGVMRSGAVNIGAYQASASAFVLGASATSIAGTPFDVTVTAVDLFGQTALGYTGGVSFTSADPYGATLPGGYIFLATDSGTRTFSAGATLYATGNWDVMATDTEMGAIIGSASISVTPAAADHLRFLQQPTDTAAGQTITPAVLVAVVDPYGNIITSDNSDTVTLALGTNPSDGTLSGTLTVTVSGGIAAFSDLSIDLVGDGYILHATTIGLEGVASVAIRVT